MAATVAKDEQWRFEPEPEVPDKFQKSLMAFEDKRFYIHPGIDPIAIGRAMVSNAKAGRVVSGASTLTMQVARLSRPGAPRTLRSKLIEAVGAIKLEMGRSKKEIMALYAANAPFGGNVVGLQAAAWRYFGRAPQDLSWAEAATLSVLPNSPALIHPGRNRADLRKKRNRVLRLLQREGVFSKQTLELSLTEELPGRPHRIPNQAPHLRSWVLKNMPAGPRTNVKTTLAANIQRMTNRAIARHADTQGRNGVHNMAALIADVQSGEILAYVGNVPEFTKAQHSNHVDIIQAPRSTGSILKPLLFAAMLRDGALLPHQIIPDIPTRMGGFAPLNFGRSFDGAVPASEALARSLNVPAVRMLRNYGVKRFYAELQSLGISTLRATPDHYGLSLILGGSEAKLSELVGIYAGYARLLNNPTYAESEQKLPASYFRLVHRKDLPTNTPSKSAQKTMFQVDRGAIYLTLKALLKVNRPNLQRGWQNFASRRPIAWKTGTSFGFRDAWAIGVTPKYAVGVWVGNADGEGRAGLTGSRAAAPLMFALFSQLGDLGGWFEEPAKDLKQIRVCKHSGHPAGPNCAETIWQDVPKQQDTEVGNCSHCQTIHLHKTKELQVDSSCASVFQSRPQKRFVLSPTMEHYYARNHPSYRSKPPWAPACKKSANEARSELEIIYPQQNAQVFLPRSLEGKVGELIFEATHIRPEQTIHWHLDDTYQGSTQSFHQLGMRPKPGKHRVTIVDENGATAQLRFKVLAANEN